MTVVVFLETAKRLGKAGFPQPPKYGITTRDIPEWHAPTATDILKEIPGWNLAYTKAFKWVVYWDAPGLAEPIQFSHENPAEAAAQAWFYENQK